MFLEVFAESRPNRDLPLVPTLLCLWGSGLVTSLVTSFLLVRNPYALTSTSPFLVAVGLLVDAAVGAIVVQYLLSTVVGRDLPYTSILVALIAGSLTTIALRVALFSPKSSSHPASAARDFFELGLISVPGLAGAFVSYWLLQRAASASIPSSPSGVTLFPPPVADVELPEDAEAEAPYSAVVASVRESSLGLVGAIEMAEPSSVPSLIANGLFSLELATKRLEETPPPDDVPVELTRRLAWGLRQLEDGLTETARAAATAANQRTYEQGFLGTRLAESSDHGGHYRYWLDESASLRTVREALDELDRLGYGTSWD